MTITADVTHSCNNSTVTRDIAIASTLTLPQNTVQLCTGERDTITLPNNPGVSYTWSPNSSPHIESINTNGSQLVLLGSATGPTPDTLTVTDNAGGACPGSDMLIIEISQSGNPIIFPDTTLCDPTVISLPTSGGVTWSGSGVVGGDMFEPSIPTTSSVTITQTVNSSAGCPGSASTVIAISQRPQVSIMNDTNICVNNTVNLNGTPASGTWNHISGPNNAWLSGSSFTPALDGIDSLEYTVTSGGCSSSERVEITTLGGPAATVSVNPNNLCGNADSTIVVVNTASNNSIIWPTLPFLQVVSVDSAIASVNTTTSFIVTIESTLGCPNSQTVNIVVDTLPNPQMNLQDSVCVDSLVTFQVASDPGLFYEWQVFDSLSNLVTSNISQNFSEVFSFAGSYDILLIGNNNGCLDTIMQVLEVVNPPNVSLSLLYDSLACSPLTVILQPQIIGNYNAILWERDGVSLGSSATAFTDQITTPGIDSITVTYCLTVFSGCDAITVCDSVTVFPRSQAGVAISTPTICPLDTLVIENNTELESRVQTYIINFGDGNIDTTSSFTNIIRQYPNTDSIPIEYTIVLTAIGSCNDTTVDSVTVTVGSNFLDPFITAGPLTGCVPHQVDFLGFSPGLPTNWQWDFGDGNSSSLQNPSHTYTIPGKYRPRLVVWNDCSIDTIYYTGPFADSIEVYEGVPFSFDVVPPSPCVGAPITVRLDSSAGLVGFSYNFGNGDSAFVPEPTYTYNTAGNFLII